jgi:hypothetical protein
MGGVRASERSRQSGSLSDIQSTLRAYLARIKEASPRVYCREASQYWAPKPICSAPVSWAQKHLTAGNKSISLEEFRKVLGLESVKDAAGNVIQEAPLQLWANFRQRALDTAIADTAIAEINEKTDLNISLESLGRSKHRRVTTLTFTIKNQAIPNGDPKRKSTKRVRKQRSRVPATITHPIGVEQL